MPCDAHSVRTAIKRANPVGHGISRSNWSNICALVRRAMRSYGAAAGKRYPDLLAPAWRELHDATVASKDKSLQRGLSRVIHWANAKGLTPFQMDDAAMAAFHRHLGDEALLPNANDRYRETCKIWNRACATIAGWPPQRLKVPVFSRTFSQLEDELPPGLKADLDSYCEIMGGNRLFDDRAPARALRPATLHATRHAIRRLGSAAMLAGVPADRLTDLAALLERSILQPALEWYKARLGGNGPSLFEAVTKLLSIGRHYLLRTEDELAPLKAVLKKLACRQRGMTPKNLERLRPFATPRNLGAIINLGDVLRAKAASGNALRWARMMRTALAHELLLCAPMRVGNLITLRIDQHFQLGKRGNQYEARIQIPADEVKNRTDLTYELPQRVAGHLSDYLQQQRPLLCADPDNKFLFPGVGLNHLTTVALSDRLCGLVFRHTGLRMNLHLYRHLAAFIYLQQHPGEYETVRQLLGHKSLATTMTFYTVLESWMSQRAYHKVLDTHLFQPQA